MATTSLRAICNANMFRHILCIGCSDAALLRLMLYPFMDYLYSSTSGEWLQYQNNTISAHKGALQEVIPHMVGNYTYYTNIQNYTQQAGGLQPFRIS